jgi:hypothetical protein
MCLTCTIEISASKSRHTTAVTETPGPFQRRFALNFTFAPLLQDTGIAALAVI